MNKVIWKDLILYSVVLTKIGWQCFYHRTVKCLKCGMIKCLFPKKTVIILIWFFQLIIQNICNDLFGRMTRS